MINDDPAIFADATPIRVDSIEDRDACPVCQRLGRRIWEGASLVSHLECGAGHRWEFVADEDGGPEARDLAATLNAEAAL